MFAERIENNEAETAAWYNELSKHISDDTKQAEAKATPEDIEVIKAIFNLKKKIN